MKKSFLVIAALSLGLFLFTSKNTLAQDVNDFVINDFHADYVLTNDVNGGRLLTTEDIDLTYAAYNHGILRALPIDYKDWNTKIKVKHVERDGTPEKYTTYSENDNLVLKIGESSRTITGHHTYKIVYEQKHVVNFEGGSPEFFWDVNGTDWSQPFTHISATVHLPPDALTRRKPQCFTGYFGSAAVDCRYSAGGSELAFETIQPFPPGANLTIAVSLANGVFTPPNTMDFIKDNLANILGFLLGPLIGLWAFSIWLFKGRDYKGRGVIIPEYAPPKGITPGEFGLLADYHIDSRDITATIIDLAIKGYIRVHEDKKKVLFISSKNYKLELLKPDYTRLKDHEKQIIEAIFPSGKAGEIIETRKINRTKMSSAVSKIRKDLQKELTDQYGYFEKNAKKLGTTMIAVGGIIFFGSFFLFNALPGLAAGGLIGGLLLMLFGGFMPRRSHAGTEVYGQIQGLKLYMNTAEKDRLKMLQSTDRPYAEPSKTVKLYEKLLPYAIALGVEKSWTKQFEGVLNSAPGWYSGSSFNTFNAAVFASSIGSVNTGFSSSYSSSSSGGGGGFSGGGGGGGGGGGW